MRNICTSLLLLILHMNVCSSQVDVNTDSQIGFRKMVNHLNSAFQSYPRTARIECLKDFSLLAHEMGISGDDENYHMKVMNYFRDRGYYLSLSVFHLDLDLPLLQRHEVRKFIPTDPVLIDMTHQLGYGDTLEYYLIPDLSSTNAINFRMDWINEEPLVAVNAKKPFLNDDNALQAILHEEFIEDFVTRLHSDEIAEFADKDFMGLGVVHKVQSNSQIMNLIGGMYSLGLRSDKDGQSLMISAALGIMAQEEFSDRNLRSINVHEHSYWLLANGILQNASKIDPYFKSNNFLKDFEKRLSGPHNVDDAFLAIYTADRMKTWDDGMHEEFSKASMEMFEKSLDRLKAGPPNFWIFYVLFLLVILISVAVTYRYYAERNISTFKKGQAKATAKKSGAQRRGKSKRKKKK